MHKLSLVGSLKLFTVQRFCFPIGLRAPQKCFKFWNTTFYSIVQFTINIIYLAKENNWHFATPPTGFKGKPVVASHKLSLVGSLKLFTVQRFCFPIGLRAPQKCFKFWNTTFYSIVQFTINIIYLAKENNWHFATPPTGFKGKPVVASQNVGCFLKLPFSLLRNARGGVLPYKRLIGMCRRMGSHFHDWSDYNGVAFQ